MGILSQKWKDRWHPIAYFLRKFSGPELSYPIYDKELLAIVLGFRQWRHYLEGAPETEVWSDHQNLKQFMSQMMLNGRQAHWLLQLAPYNFTIHYRKGSLNLADGPLHQPDYFLEHEVIEETSIGKLMPSLANKLAVAATIRAGEQCQVKGHDPYAKSLIKVLSLQATTQLEARLAADNLEPFFEDSILQEATQQSSSAVNKEKSSILDLI